MHVFTRQMQDARWNVVVLLDLSMDIIIIQLFLDIAVGQAYSI